MSCCWIRGRQPSICRSDGLGGLCSIHADVCEGHHLRRLNRWWHRRLRRNGTLRCELISVYNEAVSLGAGKISGNPIISSAFPKYLSIASHIKTFHLCHVVIRLSSSSSWLGYMGSIEPEGAVVVGIGEDAVDSNIC